MRHRAYSIQNYAEVMEFLGQVYRRNQNQHSWLPARWEYATYLVAPLFQTWGYPDWTSTIRIWEDDQGIKGIVSSENPDQNVYLQVHPDHRNLEEEMIQWAEENLAIPQAEGRVLSIWANDSDLYRAEILARRGYTRSLSCEYLNAQPLDLPLPQVDLPPGYSIGTLAHEVNLESRLECAARAFDSTGLPLAVFRTLQSAPMYRPDLDIYTKTESQVTSFCTVWYDPHIQVGYFEPVGTHPQHQRRGLGRAVLLYGLQRLKELGATKAYVGAWEDERRSFYASAGFLPFDADRPWQKRL